MEVTLNEVETPSQEIIKSAAKEAVVTDELGKSYTLKKPGVLWQYRLVDMLGESSNNQMLVGMMLPLFYVSKIDDEAIAKPNTRREIDALISRLGDEGVNAVMAGVQDHFSKKPADEIEQSEGDALKK